MTYAKDTAVPVKRSKAAIEDLLEGFGAHRIGIAIEPGKAIVGFTINRKGSSWGVRFTMPVATAAEAAAIVDRHGYPLAEGRKANWIDARNREKWRALFLTIKAKLVSVENKVETFEEAFMAHLVKPGTGQTVGEATLPSLIASSQLALSAGAPQ